MFTIDRNTGRISGRIIEKENISHRHEVPVHMGLPRYWGIIPNFDFETTVFRAIVRSAVVTQGYINIYI